MDVIERDQLAPPQTLEHWYYRAKFQLLLDRLSGAAPLRPDTRIADVGCGVGLFLTFLEQTGHARPEQMVGIDPAYAAPATALGGHAEILPAWPRDEIVDLALLMDVLEHTPDDLAVLREASGHVEKDGHIFITVPALTWLYSAHDRFLGHYRRYTHKSLRRLIQQCGDLEVISLHYFYASILPVAVPWRLIKKSRHTSACSDLRELPGWLNALLRFITHAELKLAAKNRLAGLSVVALCRKQTPGSGLNRSVAPRLSAAA